MKNKQRKLGTRPQNTNKVKDPPPAPPTNKHQELKQWQKRLTPRDP